MVLPDSDMTTGFASLLVAMPGVVVSFFWPPARSFDSGWHVLIHLSAMLWLMIIVMAVGPRSATNERWRSGVLLGLLPAGIILTSLILPFIVFFGELLPLPGEMCVYPLISGYIMVRSLFVVN